MRLLLAAVSAIVVVANGFEQAGADDAPRAILEKALKASGGGVFQERQPAVHYKMRGKIPLGVGAKEDMPFTGEVFTQPNSDFRYTIDLSVAGNPINVTMTLIGNKGRRIVAGSVEAVDEAGLEELKLGRYYDRVTSLYPVLNDKGYSLKSLGESKVNEVPVVGVQVSSAGRPDIKLYFHKTTGLMVKTEYRAKSGGEREMLHENYYDDWREPDYTKADMELLRAAKIPTDETKLTEFLRKQMPATGDAAKIKTLIKQLGDESFSARVQASKELTAIGAAAVAQLREAAESSDPEIKKRAKECLKQIGSQLDEGTVAAAIRLTARRRSPGAAELLLDWAARTGEDAIGREVRDALVAVAFADGKPVAALTAALEDKDPVRRAAAAAALGKDGQTADQRPGRRIYLTGVKFPMKAVQHQNSAKILEREYTTIEFFNRFDESVLQGAN
jgi:hypothetical protein